MNIGILYEDGSFDPTETLAEAVRVTLETPGSRVARRIFVPVAPYSYSDLWDVGSDLRDENAEVVVVVSNRNEIEAVGFVDGPHPCWTVGGLSLNREDVIYVADSDFE